MIDSENFSERLKLIMKTNQVSATQFAEKLTIPRSSISHLLSGRNKPSLEFVLKVLKYFPDVEFYWLLNGDGVYPMPLEKKEKSPTPSKEKDSSQKKTYEIKSDIKNMNEIERIVIFFKDGSFKSYSS